MSDQQYSLLRQSMLMQLQEPRNKASVAQGTQPGSIFFARELASLLGCDEQWLEQTAQEYRDTPEAWKRLSGLRSTGHQTDGFAKSLDVAEGFAVWALVKQLQPRVVVELGSQYGISARLWKEALRRYVPDHVLYLCDIDDLRRFITPEEANFVQGDGVESLRSIIDATHVDLLINDAHPYTLIRDSVLLGKERNVGCFVFHDVSATEARYRPFRVESAELTEAEREERNVAFEVVGHWERHAMVDHFDPAARTQLSGVTDQWRWQIFDSLFGLGVVLRQPPAGR
jgi:hypothetical protein